jgi:hypothetical protein
MSSKIIVDKNFNNTRTFQSLKVPIYSSLPPATTGQTGNIIFNQSDNQYYGCDGTTWFTLAGFSDIPPGVIINVDGTISLTQFLTTNVFNSRDGTLQITGSDGPPTGDPGTIGGELVWDINTGDLYIHTGGGVWRLIGGGLPIIPPGTIVNVDGSISFPQFTTNIFNTTDGTLRITGSDGVPTGNPGTDGGEIVWDINTGDLYIHTGSGSWEKIGPQSLSDTLIIGNTTDGLDINLTSSNLVVDSNSNVVTEQFLGTGITNGFITITGINGNPTGVPSGSGQLVRNATTNQLFIHTGAGSWLPISGTIVPFVLNNIGVGVQVFDTASPVGVGNLRTLVSSDSSITISQIGNEINLTLSPLPPPSITLQNQGLFGAAVYNDTSVPPVYNFRRLYSSNGSLTVLQEAEQINLQVTASSTSAISNEGGGAEIYIDGTASPFELRTLTSPTATVTITEVGDEIQLEVAGATPATYANLGSGEPVWDGAVSPVGLNTLSSSDSSVLIDPIPGGGIDLRAVLAGPGTIDNVGGGSEIYKTGTSSPFELRTLESSDSSIAIIDTGDTLNLQVTTSPFTPSINANLFVPTPSGRLQVMNVANAGTPWEPSGVSNQGTDTNVIYFQAQQPPTPTEFNTYLRMEVNQFTGTTIETANNATYGATYPGVPEVINAQDTNPSNQHFNDLTITSGNNMFISGSNRGNVFVNAGSNFFDTGNLPGDINLTAGGSGNGSVLGAGNLILSSGSWNAQGNSTIRCNGPNVVTSPTPTAENGTIEFVQNGATIIEINRISTTDIKQGNLVLSNPTSNVIVAGGSVLVSSGGNIRLLGPGGQLTTNTTANIFITTDGDVQFNPSRGIYMVYPTITLNNLPRPNYLSSSSIAPIPSQINMDSSAGEIEFDFSNQPFWGTGSLDFQLNNNKITADSQLILTPVNGSVNINANKYPIDVYSTSLQNGQALFTLTNNSPNYNIPFIADNSSPWIAVGGNSSGNIPIWWSGTQFAFERFRNAELTANGQLKGVIRTKEGTYIAVGRNKSLLRSPAGIQSWSVVTTPTLEALPNQDFTAIEQNTYNGQIVIGTSRGVILSSNDDGLTWSILNSELLTPTQPPPPNPPRYLNIKSIKFDMLTEYWMICGAIASSVFIPFGQPKGAIFWSQNPSMLASPQVIERIWEVYSIYKDPFYSGWHLGGELGYYFKFTTDIPSTNPANQLEGTVTPTQSSATNIKSVYVDSATGYVYMAGSVASPVTERASIWRSINGGISFTNIFVASSGNGFVFESIFKDPSGNRFFASGGTGPGGAIDAGGNTLLYQSYDGNTWTIINNPVESLDVPGFESRPFTVVYKPQTRQTRYTTKPFTGVFRVRFAIIEKRV